MIASRLISWMIKQNVIAEEEKELYEYACRTIVYLFSPLLIAFLVGILYGKIIEALIMILPFIILRFFSGGFHMNSLTGCVFFSVLLVMIFFSVAQIEFTNEVYCFLAIISAISIIVFSPIATPQKAIMFYKVKKYKEKSAVLVFIVLATILILGVIGNAYYARFLVFGMLMVAFLQWLYYCTKNKERYLK